jgi:hypothetical protein
MRYGRRSNGIGYLFPRGRPRLVTVLVAFWAGFMVATAGAALYPPVTAIVTPLVCPGRAEVESQTFSTRPGETIVTREYLCTAPGAKPESIMFRTLAATCLAYSLIAFVLLTLVGLWRGRRGAAAAPVAEPAWRTIQFPPDPILERIIGSPRQPRDAGDQAETARRLAELKRLHESGLIDGREYEEKKAEILSSL